MSNSPKIAIICEFNPFHKGHEYLLNSVKKIHPNATVICIMSGNYVQRGEPAIADKYLRAKIAVISGADLVLELPLPFSVMSAQDFAKGAIHIINHLGKIDYLCFGSESGDTKALVQFAKKTTEKRFVETLRQNMIKYPHRIYPKILDLTYRECFGKSSGYLEESSPNDILAIEYIKELLRSHSKILPWAIKREGSGHNNASPSEEYASAAALRILLSQNRVDDVSNYMNSSGFELLSEAVQKKDAPISRECYDRIMLSKLREMNLNGKDFGSYLYCAPLADKLIREVPRATNLSDLYERLKSKNFTLARIKRAVISCYLEIPRNAVEWCPEYSVVLAMTRKGSQYLSQIRKTKTIPLITKAGMLNRIRPSSPGIELNINADKRYTLLYPSLKEEAQVFKKSPYRREE